MKGCALTLVLLLATAVAFAGCTKADTGAPVQPPAPEMGQAKAAPAAPLLPADLQKNVKAALDRAAKFLKDHQAPEGSWDKNPGITGICTLALLKSGRGYSDVDDPFIRKPVQYLVGLQKTDGGIYEQELANYTTSVAVQVLLSTKNPAYKDNIAKARAFLLGQQLDAKSGYESSDPGFGGIGYGSSLRPDLSNTQMWADALRDLEKAGLEKDSDAWKKAVVFISRCQNRSESNDRPWSSDDGGVTYSPWESKAYEVPLPDGRKGLRSYGSMTYAFLKTMIYADVKKDDPRVVAAYDWIRKNYSVEENPQMGQQGLFYYYHTMAKALKAIGEPTLMDDKGVAHDWRKDLTEKILSLQAADGSWVNKNDRWFESNPDLVTAYGILTLGELLDQ